jgi:hypothetical protein
MNEQTPDYLSYLLRLRRTHSGGAPVWRVALEEPLTQEVRHFDDLPGLLAFLAAQTEQGPGTDKHSLEVPPRIEQ